MKIAQKHSPRKKVALFIIIAVILLAGGATYAVYLYKSRNHTNQPSQTVNLDKPTKEQVQQGTSIKEQSADSQKSSSTSPSAPNDGKLIITAANQNQNILQIRALINGLETTGNCVLTLTKDTQTVTKTVGTQALASSSTCQGFDIPTSELSPGDWSIAITVTAGTSSSTATSKVTIQ